MSNKKDKKERIFILGSERSGSTWLSNVLDAHPDIEFFMEPFADYAHIFPGVPERNFYIEEPEDTHLGAIKKGYKKLHRMKYPWFYHRGRPLFFKIWDQIYSSLLRRILWHLHIKFPLSIHRYHLLHLNNDTIPLHHQTRKRKRIAVEATKELRLNFKMHLLAKSFPDAKYLVTIRHPGAQIASIQRLFSKNSLGELSKNLDTFIQDILEVPRFKKYTDLIRQFDWEHDREVILVLWWLINYDVLLDDLSHLRLPHRVVYHEEISSKPQEEATRIYQFIGLEMTNDVIHYLTYSSHGKVRNKKFSNLDTSRLSVVHSKETIAAVEPSLLEKIREITGYHAGILNPRLRHYLSRF